VISGIGFLGAGVIMKEGMNVRGLNTAATCGARPRSGLRARRDLPLDVISGIGFLGAGVIMKEGMNVRGLNTAATCGAR
ncbi:hypothetical protein CTI14_68685, partial [Methylobacterium radiotolerans]